MKRNMPILTVSILILLLASGVAHAGEYVNQTFGFSLDYPDDYSVSASSDHYFSIRDKEGRIIFDGTIESLSYYPQGFYGNIKDPLLDFGIDRTLLRCSADGPDGSAYCTSVQSAKEFRTQHGTRAIELYLNHVQETYGENPETMESVVGPVYLFDMSRRGQTVVLIVGDVPYLKMSAGQKSATDNIINTLKKLE